jgi:hypothetical protein
MKYIIQARALLIWPSMKYTLLTCKTGGNMTLRTTHRLKQALLLKYDADPRFVVDVARRNIPKIQSSVTGSVEMAYVQRWTDALSNASAMKSLIADETSDGLSAWQLAPFAGVFTAKERWQILKGEIQ